MIVEQQLELRTHLARHTLNFLPSKPYMLEMILQFTQPTLLTACWGANCCMSGLGICRGFPCSAVTALLAVISCCRTDGTVGALLPI